MADLNELQSAQTTKIAGASPSTGAETFYVDVDSGGNAKVSIGASDGSNTQRLEARTTSPLRDLNGLVVRSIPFEVPTFRAFAPSVAIANGKSMISIYNTTGSAVKIRIQSLMITSVQNANTSGVVADYQMRRITGHTIGTGAALTTTPATTGQINANDSSDSLDSSVTVFTGGTVSGETAFPLWRITQSSDEWGVKTSGVESNDHSNTILSFFLQHRPPEKAITLNANEGISIRQNTNSTNGTFDIQLTFTQESV
jgi:hypothetical protein